LASSDLCDFLTVSFFFHDLALKIIITGNVEATLTATQIRRGIRINLITKAQFGCTVWLGLAWDLPAEFQANGLWSWLASVFLGPSFGRHPGLEQVFLTTYFAEDRQQRLSSLSFFLNLESSVKICRV
jgi:hypothetical protein